MLIFRNAEGLHVRIKVGNSCSKAKHETLHPIHTVNSSMSTLGGRWPPNGFRWPTGNSEAACAWIRQVHKTTTNKPMSCNFIATAYKANSHFVFESNLVVVLRSEIPSGICAKLRTVAASNNRVHMPWSLCYCLFAPQICTVLFFTHIPFVVNHTINATPPERLQQHKTRCTSSKHARKLTAEHNYPVLSYNCIFAGLLQKTYWVKAFCMRLINIQAERGGCAAANYF